MSWKAYLATLGVRHTFEKFGLPDFYVILRRVDSYPYANIKKRAPRQIDIAQLEANPELAAELQREQEDLLAQAVMEWNLTDPNTDQPLALPKDDPTALDVLPTEFVVQLNMWLVEDSTLAKTVPNPRGISSGPR